jgi:hypothetical protein
MNENECRGDGQERVPPALPKISLICSWLFNNPVLPEEMIPITNLSIGFSTGLLP